MNQDNKPPSGAPSSDTTSALFVSARKKQLEQQELEQRAREKEEQRLAAEAEVRRLEAEVEERRRRAAEDAKRAEEETRRIAEEARAKMAQAAENPDAVLGAPPQVIPKPVKKEEPVAKTPRQGKGAENLLKNKKLLAIIGGGLAVIILAVVLIVVLGGGAKPVTASGSDFSGIWYSGPSDSYDTFEFFDKGRFTLTFFDGESISGKYTVDGEDVEITYQDSTETLTVDGNIMTGEYLVLTREIGDAAGYHISGYYYLAVGGVINESIFLYFDTDGTVTLTTDEESTGTFVVEGDVLTINELDDASSGGYILEILDENTLYDPGNELNYVRVAEDVGTDIDMPQEPISIDPDAALNASAIIEGVGMIVKYPDTIFQEAQLTEGRLALVSVDGYASIEAAKGDTYQQAPTNDAMIAYKDKTQQRAMSVLPGEVVVIESGFYSDENTMPFVYYELSYSSEGVVRYMCWFGSLWVNERTGDRSYVEIVLDCPESERSDYFALFTRIRESRDDA